MKDELLTIQQAADLLGVSTRTLRRWEHKGHLKPQRTIGNQRRYNKAELTALFKKETGKAKFPTELSLNPQAPIVQSTPSLPQASIQDSSSFLTPVQVSPQQSSQEKQGESKESPVVGISSFEPEKPHLPSFRGVMVAGAVFGIVLFMGVAMLIAGSQQMRNLPLSQTNSASAAGSTKNGAKTTENVLAAQDQTPAFTLNVNIPGVFGQKVTFLDTVSIKKALTVSGISQLNGGVKTNNADINAGSGKLTASNVIYSINPGTNITITGDKQNPIISASVPPSVTSFQGATGAIELAEGTGIAISDTTITNSDPGSAQNIFKTFSVDGTDIAAGNNNDTVNFAAGSGITLSGDSGSKTITITNDSSGTLSGLTPNGVLYALTSSSADTTVPGTTGTVLHGITNGAPVFSAVDLTADVTGILPVSHGGSGTGSTPGQGQILIGNGSSYDLETITAGSGIGVTNGAGTITLTNSGVLSLTGTANEVNVSGSTGAIILTLPQQIAPASTPSFASLNVTNATNQLRLGSGNTGVISIATLTGGRTYTFPDASGTVCLTSGNCSGSGGTLTGSGSVGFLAEFTGPSGIGDSVLYDNGKIGLGTTSPQGLFSVSGAVPGLALVDLNETSGTQSILVGSSSGTTRFVFDQNGNLNIIGGSYEIGGANVLSSNTLGNSVINSSLTGVGALISGSIVPGFGTIDIGSNSISGGDITATGTTGYSSSGNGAGLSFSGSGNHIISASTGVLELGGVTLTSTVAGGGQSITGLGSLNGLVIAANTGVVTSGTWHGTVIGSQYGGTGIDTSGSTGVPFISNGTWSVDSNALSEVHGGTGQTGYALGDILYADSTTTLARRAIGGDGQILTVSGGVPVWSNVGGSINFWQEALGAIAPINISDDLLLGATATNSAKFAFENVAGGVPTASISAGTANNNTFITGAGVLGTTNKQTLTFGSTSTGNLDLFNFGSGVVHTNASGVLSTSPVSLTADVTGVLQVGNGGTGVGSFGGTNTLLYTSSANTLSSITTANNGVLVTDAGGVPSISSSLPTAVQSNITHLGTISNGIWQGTAIGAQYGGTGQTSYAIGDLLYSDTSTTLARLAIGGNNTCLVSNGTTPSWAPCSAGGTNYWQENLGAISPANITDDLLLGATATNSAKFAFENVAGGVPTASISAGTANNNTFLTGAGVLGTTNKQTLTFGSTSTGNLDLFNFGSGVVHTNASGVLSTGAVSLTADVSGILPVSNGGTGVNTFGGTNTLLYTTSADTLASIATANNGVLITGGGGVPSISSSLPTAVQNNITSLGTIGSGIWQGTAIGAVYGGTGQTGYTIGDILYADSTTTLAKLAIGSINNCLISNGSTPAWSPCSGLGTNYWQENLGAVSPLNITDDLLLGATATNSAKFAFENVAGGVPTASISAGTANNNTFLTGAGVLGTTNKQTLTFGSTSTGNLDLFNFGSGVVHTNASGVLSTGAVALGSSDVSGTLGVTNGGTGVGTFGGTNTLLYTTAANTLSSITTANNGVLVTDGSGVPSISSSLPTAVQNNITSLGTIGSGIWQGTAIGAQYGGTGQTGYTIGDILYADTTSTLAKLAIGSINNCLISNGSTPAWSPCSGLGTNYWQENLGAISPLNITDDLLLGGTATTSARFAFINSSGPGIPTASISAGTVNNYTYITGDGSLATTNKQTLTLGSTSTGNIDLFNFGSGVVHTNASGVLSTGAVALGSSDVSGTLGVTNGGTGVGSFGGTNTLLYTTSANTLSSITTANNGVLVTSAGGVPSISSILPTAVQTNITSLGTIGTGVWNGSVIGTGFGGTGQTTYTDGQLLIGNSTGTTLTKATLTAGTGINITNGHGSITIGENPSALSKFTEDDTLGVLYPNISTLDVLFGGTATSSAKFAFLNNAAGTPTASVSATSVGTGLAFSGDGSIQSLLNGNLTLGGTTTGNIVLSPLNGITGAYVAPSTNGQVDLGTSTLAFRNIYALSDIKVNGTSVCLADGTHCPNGSANYWDQLNGVLTPKNESLDLLLGSQASSSAKFAFINVNSGTPTASISANTANNFTFLTGDGTLATTDKQTLTLGSATTGNIGLFNFGAGAVMTDANGFLSSGTLPVGDGGTGLASIGAGALVYGSGGSSLSTLAIGGSTGECLVSTGSAPSWQNCPGSGGGTSPFMLTGNTVLPNNHIYQLGLGTTTPGDVTSELYVTRNLSDGALGQALAIFNQTENQDILTASASGVTKFTIANNGDINATGAISGLTGLTSSGQIKFTGAAFTGTNAILVGTAGTGVISTITTSTSNLCIVSGPSGPVWNSCSGLGTNYWQENAGALAPLNITDDLLLGGTSTSSATFAFENVAGTTPTASIAGNLSLVTPKGANPNALFNILNGGTLNFQTSAGGDGGLSSALYISNNHLIGIGTNNPGANLDVSGTERILGGSSQLLKVQNSGGTIIALDADTQNGRLGIGTAAPVTTLDVRATSGITSIASISGATAFAGLVVDQSGVGNIFSASVSGASKFSILNNGNVQINNLGTGIAHVSSTGVLSSSAVGLGSTDVSGTLPVNKGGTGVGTFGGTNTLLYTTSADTLASIATANNGVLVTDAGGTPSISSSLPTAVQNNITSLGTIGSGIWQGTAIGAVYGGTGQTGYAIGDLLYADTTTSLAKLAIGGNNSCLVSNGTNPSWAPCSGLGTNYWQENLGAVSPLHITDDLLLGATATNSAKFAFENVAGGVPTASISAGTANNNTFLTGAGVLGTTNKQTLTFGSTSTGNLDLFNFGSGVVHTNASGVLSTGAVALGSSDVSGTLGVTNGGTGVGSFGGTNTLLYTTAANTLSSITTANNGVLVTSAGGVPSISSILPTAVQSNITQLGTISAGIWQGTAIGAVYGGTGQTGYTIGDILYADTTTSLAKLAIGGNNNCLISNGSTPAWSPCSGLGTNYWQENLGAVSPLHITDDLLLGATATNSAKFAFKNVASGVPTASISANSANNYTYITGDGSLATTNKQTLTLGSTSTGNLDLFNFGSGVVHTNASGVLSTGAVALGSSDVSGTLGVTNGGTGVGSFGGTNTLLYTTSANTLSSIATANNGVLITSGGGVPSISSILPSAVQSNITQLGTISAGVWNGTAIGAQYGGTGQTGYAIGDLLYADSTTTLAKRAIGTSGQILTVSGGVPVWSNAGGTINFWQENLGAVSPLNITDDLLLGATATNSAKFAFENVAGGVPTASISAGTANNNTFLTGAGVLGTTNKQTLTFGSTSTGNLDLFNFGSGVVHTNASGVLSTGAVALGSSDVSGTLGVTNGGTGVGSFGGTNTLLYTTAANTLSSITTANNGVLITGAGGVPSISSILPTAVQTNITSLGTIGTGVWNGTVIGAQYGGTGQTGYAIGDLLYADTTTSLAKLAIGGNHSCLVSNGTGPSWASCSSLGTNYWQENLGAVSPLDITDDLLLGATATNSAKFAFENVASGVPTASISAGTANNYTYITGNGSLATTNKQTLTLGSTSTGNLDLFNFGSGVVHTNASGVLSTGAVALGSSDVSGTLGVTNGGTGVGSFGGTNTLLYTTSANTLSSIATANNGVLITSGGGVPSISSILPSAVQGNITSLGTIGTGIWHGTVIGAAYGGTGTDTSAATGVPYISGGAWSVDTNALAAAHGGTGLTSVAKGDLLYGSGTNTWANLGIGGSGQILTVSGGVPVWSNVGGSINFWQENLGALAPLNISDDLLLGSTATNSAKFAFKNVGSGVPTASISANSANNYTYITGDGSLATTDRQTLTLGSASTGNISLSPMGGLGTVTSTGTFNLSTGKTYQIGGADVLSSTQLGTAVITSSLTTVGALTGGSISSGFGTIATANTITGTTLNGTTGINTGTGGGTNRIDSSGDLVSIVNTTTSGTVQFSHFGTGIAHLDSTGNLSSSAVDLTTTDVTNTLPSGHGGTGINSYLTGQLLYGNGGSTLSTLNIGGAGQILTVSGGIPQWENVGGTINFWQETNGAVEPLNLTDDLLLGSTATNSAKFAFENVAGGVPTASISANSANNYASLTGTGVLGTTNRQTLTIGSTSTGNIVIASGTNITQFNDNTLSLAGSAPLINSTSNVLSLNTQSNNGITTGTGLFALGGNLQLDGGNILDNNAMTRLTLNNGNLGINTSTPFALLDVRGTNGINGVSGTVPVASISGLTSFASLLVDNAGVGDLFTASKSGATKFTILNNGNLRFNNYTQSGGVLYTDGSGNVSQAVAGGNGQVLQLVGGVPTWVSAGTAGINVWQEMNGAISPYNITDDLLLGGTATTSAKFAFINNIGSGTPTASISAGTANNNTYLTGSGILGTTNRQTLTLGGPSTGDISFQPGGQAVGTSLYLASNGQVAIGTNTPGAWGGAALTVSAASSTSVSGIDLVTPTNAPGDSQSIQVNNRALFGYDGSTGNAFMQGVSGHGVELIVSGTSIPFSVDSSGYTMIGTSAVTADAEQALLTVSGSASISGQLSLYGTPQIQSTAMQTLTLGGTTTGNVLLSPGGSGQVQFFNANNSITSAGALTLASNETINGTTLSLGNGSTATIQTSGNGNLQLGQNAGNGTVVIQPNAGGQASLIVKNQGSGDLFTASAGATTKFTIQSNGNIAATGAISGLTGLSSSGTITLSNATFQGNNAVLYGTAGSGQLAGVAATSTANQCLLSGLNTAAPSWGSCALGTNYWQLVGNVISPAIQTNSLAIGTTTSLASGLDVRGLNATQSVASVSGASNFANLVVDQSGTGDIFTASKSGATKFVINNNGNVGIGTAIAGANLDIQSNSLTTTNAFNVSATALTTGSAAVLNVNGTNVLTSGQALQINGPTGAAAISNNSGLVKIITSGALTGTAGSGTHLDIIGDNTLTATLASISDASVMTGNGELLSLQAAAATTTTNGLFNITGTGLTTGFAEKINMAGTNVLTSGGALDIVGPTGAAAITNNTGLVQINSSGALTTTAGSGGLLDVIGNNTITGTLASISDSSVMTGNGELLSLQAAAATTTTNGLFNITGTGLTTGFAEKINMAGTNVLTSGGALDIVGPTGAAAITNNTGLVQINSSGALTTTAGSGGLLDVIGNNTITGTLASISDSSVMTGNGELLSLQAAAATTTTNGLFNINGAGLTTGSAAVLNVNGTNTLTSGQALQINGPTSTAAISNNSGLVKIVTSGALTTTAGSGGLLDMIGNGTITGTLASISDNSIMTTTGNLLYLTADSATTTTGLETIHASGLTTGWALNITAPNAITTTGNVGINTSTALATLDVRGTSGTTPVASVAGATAFAAEVVDNSGLGDLFTASKSGATKFVITNAGNVGIGTTSPAYALSDTSSNLTDFAGNGTSTSGIGWDMNTAGKYAATIYNANATGYGLDVGSASTSNSQRLLTVSNGSADVFNVTGSGNVGIGTIAPAGLLSVASANTGNVTTGVSTWGNSFSVFGPNAGNSTGTALALGYDTTDGTAVIDSGTPGSSWNSLELVSSTLSVFSNGIQGLYQNVNGNVGLGGTTSPEAPLVVKGAYGSNAAAIINQMNSGDIFVASQSGATKFQITNAGRVNLVGGNATSDFDTLTNTTLKIGAGSATTLTLGRSGQLIDLPGYGGANNSVLFADNTVNGVVTKVLATSTANQCLLSAASGTPAWGSCDLGTTSWVQNNGVIFPGQATEDFLLGGTNPSATASAGFHVYGTLRSGTNPVASISGNTSFASLIVDNAGVGDLFTASKSGSTKFVIANSGNVGIGTTSPGVALDINAGAVSGNGIRMSGAATDTTLQLINSSSGGQDWNFDTVGAGSLLSAGELSIGTFGANPLLALQGAATVGGTGGGQIGINVPAAIAGGAIHAALDVRGNLATQPVGSFSGSTNFAAMVVNNSGTGDIFTASASGLTRFTVKNNGVVVIGNNTNGITFDPTGSTTAIYSGTARPTKQIILSPEYAGAVLTASASAYPNGANGFMTSDASPSASTASYNFENYYQWLSTQTTPALQTYVVAVKVTLPKDFSGWAASNPVQVDYNTSTTSTNSNLDIFLYNTTSSTPIAYHQNLATSGPWQTNTITGTELGSGAGWNTAGQTAVFYMTMQAWNNAYVQIGDIKLNYLAQF